MADIELYEEDPEDTIESDTAVGFEDYDSDPCDPDAGLSMLQRLEKYCHDENMYTRQMVTRSLLETIRTIENEDETHILLDSIVTLADDPEAIVRSELMEHIPHVAIYCLENLHIFGDPIPTHLLPIVVKYITDMNNQVRKTSQAALLVLLEQEMIKKDDVIEQVCPVILDLSHPESMEDFRTEAVALMSKLAPLVGKDATEHLFLERFGEMCTDPLFSVRKVCATNFGDFCQVVGQENTENVLLAKFFYLCEDGVWGVRKACAECFTQVSCVCSLTIRRSELAQLFVNLICDQSRWVRMAAFQALGSFISTFADPSNTGLYFDDEGLLRVGHPDNFPKSRGNSQSDDFCSDSKSCDSVSEESVEGSSSQGTDSPSHQQDHSGSDSIINNNVDSETKSSALQSDGQQVVTMDTTPDVNDVTESIQQLQVDKSVEESRAAAQSSQERGDSGAPSSPGSDSNSCDAQSGNSSDSESVSSSSGACDNNNTVDLPPQSRQCVSDSDLGAAGPDVCVDGSRPPDGGKKVHIHMDNNNTAFNTFQYWRMPLPEIDVDVDIVDGKAANIHIKTKVKDADTSTALVSQFDVKVSAEETSPATAPQVTTSTESTTEAMEVDPPLSPSPETGQADEDATDEKGVKIHTASVSTVCETVEEVANIGSTHILGHHVNESTMTLRDGVVQGRDQRNVNGSNLGYIPVEESPGGPPNTSEEPDSADEMALPSDQDVIPQALLDHYLSMTDPSRAQTVDSEIAKHCAYSLPAVAYTLGRRYWPCLRDLYESLAGDMQWKVRRTLAFSIHELAVIVGEDITARDLVPIFNGFLKDLDEVRIGILRHLGDFLKLLKSDVRQEYLTKIYEFLNTDNTRNWRFREELAIQLRSLLNLYSAGDITDHLVPVAFMLAEDTVAAVRYCAFKVLSAMIGRLTRIGDEKKLMTLIHDIKERFTLSPRWINRQMYVHICTNLLEDASMSQEMFANEILPVLISLSQDPTPNVRIAVSRTISRHILNSDYFTSGQNPHHTELLETIQLLQADKDRDVRFFMQPMSESADLSTDTIPV